MLTWLWKSSHIELYRLFWY